MPITSPAPACASTAPYWSAAATSWLPAVVGADRAIPKSSQNRRPSPTMTPTATFGGLWVMDARNYTTLMDAVVDIPDPRHARGKRHRWAVLLTLISAALLSGQRNGRAIGQWVDEHTVELMTRLPLPQRPLPSTSTLRRALQAIDVGALEARLARFAAELDPPRLAPETAPWQGQAVDGKAVRGANRHGAQVHLVSLVQHSTGRVCGQVRVRDKSNEITAVPQ